VLPPEKLKVWAETLKEGKKGIPFVTVRVEDNTLVEDSERARSVLFSEVNVRSEYFAPLEEFDQQDN